MREQESGYRLVLFRDGFRCAGPKLVVQVEQGVHIAAGAFYE